ncbi:hypothetical protein GCM10020258_03990 [Sphingomonas yabuuchiae]
MRIVERQGMVRIGEGFAKRIERTGTDIPEHDTDRPQCEAAHALRRVRIAILVRGAGDPGGRDAHDWRIVPVMERIIGDIRGNPVIIAPP